MNARIIETENGKRLGVLEALKIWREDNSDSKTVFFKAIELKKYVPIAAKSYLAVMAMDQAHAVYDNKERSGNPIDYKKSSYHEYIYNVIGILNSYTNIDTNDDNMGSIVIYDLLQNQGIIQRIITEIGSDITEWTRVWNLIRDDYMDAHFTTHGFLSTQLKKFWAKINVWKATVVSAAAEAAKNPRMEELLQQLNIDIDELKSVAHVSVDEDSGSSDEDPAPDLHIVPEATGNTNEN